MDNSQLISKYKGQIASQENSLSSLYSQNISHQKTYDQTLGVIHRLEVELENLLEQIKKMDHELQKLEELTQGAGSRMKKIQFFEHGRLESKAFEAMQARLVDIQQEQQSKLLTMADRINNKELKAQDLEQQIENQRAKLMQLDQLMASNRNRIHSLKAQIASSRSTLRTLQM
ncbi:hypothetical protein HXA34_01760 [Salipaludibacillus agaradhaerens]|jgi:chromosome segregation ATPase|uniref:hypothetical protein n=1 Tax=Salipaludibacillus agaradhaerens TaxID=76935 RepID=UPI0021516C29|nr:hypothetical protein [Salipaludibacillus agaradhaerens]MCR6105010.1 hypothetical protein [Salipaludibacillus agaradhaerens]MCR6117055.1 hypothetical protein [Salipaludibacillus agaradhaerens]